jgi:hypothetical protein
MMISPGSTGAEEPPGITAFSLRPPRMPPAISSSFGERRAHRHLEVAGTIDVAGDREQLGAAVVGLAQIQEGFSPPMPMMKGTEAKVSVLLMVVGLP